MDVDELFAPTFVIAMPQLADPNFHRTVVLVVECNEEGAFGIVVNRALEAPVAEFCESLEVRWGGDGEDHAQFGGPVGVERGFVLHGPIPDDVVVNSREILPGLSIALDMETFETLCRRPPEDFRMFLGYSGWAPGQLEAEIREGAWLTTTVTRELVFETPPEEIWEAALTGLGIDPNRLVLGTGMH